MSIWFSKVFTRFECSRYVANRIISVRKDGRWVRGLHAINPDHIKYLDDMFGPGPSYDMYVSGFTFAWDRFIKEYGPIPSSANRAMYYSWVHEKMVPNLKDFINKKDIVFEIDRKEGHGIRTAGSCALRIRDSLRSLDIKDIHFIFSGRGGYHVIAEDGEKYFKTLQSTIYGRTPESLSHAAIQAAQNLLDETFKEPFLDQGGRGRSYDTVDIHFSPMFPQGLRKAAYSLTSHGTVALPVSEKELDEVDDIQHYTPLNVLKNYAIKGRGWKI